MDREHDVGDAVVAVLDEAADVSEEIGRGGLGQQDKQRVAAGAS